MYHTIEQLCGIDSLVMSSSNQTEGRFSLLANPRGIQTERQRRQHHIIRFDSKQTRENDLRSCIHSMHCGECESAYSYQYRRNFQLRRKYSAAMSFRRNVMTSPALRRLIRTMLGVLMMACCFVCSNATGIPCNTTTDCEQSLNRTGSECLSTGLCSNPFHVGGCLAQMLQKKNEEVATLNTNESSSTADNNVNNLQNKSYMRVCTSADPPDAEELGHCAKPEPTFDYMEIRLLGLNWESVFFETWIVQILLSEVLGVPTSVESGYRDKAIDFYDIHSRFDYGKGYDYDAFRMAMEVDDCRQVVQPRNTSNYKSCAHVGLEFWLGQKAKLQIEEDDGIIDNPSALGALGYAGWHIPRFTAERDPTLLNYIGLSGEANRRKLAEAFKRPTKWIDYCTQVSASNCSIPDSTAQRAPETEEEKTRMFVKGLYTGHFRKTEKNDCDTYPDTCTGHIADLPCDWTSFVQQQTHHLNIALESDGDEPGAKGYSYSQLVEIWAAANATKSNVAMMWWTPEPLYETYLETDAEFLRVTLPPTTQRCVNNRVLPSDRCSGIPEKVYGSPLGKCDDEPHPLMKVITKNLRLIATDPSLPEVKRSPAYDLIDKFEISSLQLGEIFQKWQSRDFDKWNYDPREAVCEWVVENFDAVNSFVPLTYPRVIQDRENESEDPLFFVAITSGCLALLLSIATSITLYQLRSRRAIKLAQIEFLSLIMVGLVLGQLGSITSAVRPSNATCIANMWFLNLGYTLELVPLLVKIAAINRLMAAAKSMKRIVINRQRLLVSVAAFTLGMAMFLIIWTIESPSHKSTDYVLTSDVLENGETIVSADSSCKSDQSFWDLIALGWRSVLLFCATILAFQSRSSPVNINESKTLALVVYSKFVFLLLTFVIFLLGDKVQASQLQLYGSLLESLDSSIVCCIYFIPKLLLTDEAMAKANLMMKGSLVYSYSHQPGTSATGGRPFIPSVSSTSGTNVERPTLVRWPSEGSVRQTKANESQKKLILNTGDRIMTSSDAEDIRILFTAAKKRKQEEEMRIEKTQSMSSLFSGRSLASERNIMKSSRALQSNKWVSQRIVTNPEMPSIPPMAPLNSRMRTT